MMIAFFFQDVAVRALLSATGAAGTRGGNVHDVLQ